MKAFLLVCALAVFCAWITYVAQGLRLILQLH
jgi:hypothetical protein